MQQAVSQHTQEPRVHPTHGAAPTQCAHDLEDFTNITERDIKQQEIKLALMRATFSTNSVEVKFRPYHSGNFFHKVKLPAKSVDLLRNEVARRLHVDVADISYLVTNGDELVEQDEQLVDGLSVIVY